MKFQCYTLGCKVNQYESQAMEQQLLALGHEKSEDFDLCIVNTCTVTAVADRKNRTLIRKLRREHPDAIIGVCGCYAQVSTDEVKALGVDVVSGSGGREEFVRMLLHASREKQQVQVDEALKRRKFEILPPGGLPERTRALLKVQDGCSNFCTYCIIPYARGPVRSQSISQAVKDLKQLEAEGYKEVVITGIEIASWGWDLRDGTNLTDLCEALCRATPNLRLRLGSLEPRVIDEDFCRRLCGFSNLCPQFHLSMQSGSNTVLKRMGRKYDSARYYESVELLNRYFPGCAVTTDLIVGCPGETEEELEESLAFCRKCGCAKIHVFPYSRRPGTPAAAMKGQISRAEKAERSTRANGVAEELRKQYDTALMGKDQEVLFEQTEDGYFTGHAKNGVKVFYKGENLRNVLKTVKISGLLKDGVLGED